MLSSRRTSQVSARLHDATKNEGALPAFFLARIADGGVASTLEVCVRFSYHAASQIEEINMKYQKLTPNLVVNDVEASLNFYQTVLGFERGMTVP